LTDVRVTLHRFQAAFDDSLREAVVVPDVL
jgi:hypothetical protein